MEEPRAKLNTEEFVSSDGAELPEEVRVTAANILETVREPLLILDSALHVVAVNRAFYETFHVYAEDTLGLPLYQLGNGQWDIPDLRRLMDEILPRNNPVYDYQVEHDFDHIGRKVMVLNARRLEKTPLHPEYILLAIEDVTERLAREASLYESQSRFQLLAKEAVDYAIFMLDADGHVITWSEGARQMKQYTEDEILGEHFRVLYPEEDRAKEKPENELVHVRAEGRLRDIWWRRKKDGSLFWADVTITGLHNEQGELIGFGKVVKDLTEEKRIDEERERLRKLELVEMALAREQHVTDVLQRSLLLTPPDDYFPDLLIASRYEPALEEASVGGDFLDAFVVEGGKIALVVGDAAGKGLEAAARTAEVKFALRAYLKINPEPRLADVMEQLNRLILAEESYENNLEGSFIAMSLALVDPRTGDFELCLAGSEPPLLLRAGGECEELPHGGLPLGVEKEAKYFISEHRLDTGDTLIITTDGMTEARSPKDAVSGVREFLGFEGLMGLARDARDAPTLVDMAQTIFEGVSAFAAGQLHDDTCLLLARRR